MTAVVINSRGCCTKSLFFYFSLRDIALHSICLTSRPLPLRSIARSNREAKSPVKVARSR
jgi:hypothetical protein